MDKLWSMTVGCMMLGLLPGALAADEDSGLASIECWGARRARNAVVNPVKEGGDVVSLRGEWDFRQSLRPLPVRNGIWKHFATDEWKDFRKIQVPACWEAQGVGEPGVSEVWDPVWDEERKEIRHKWMGEGWYRKDVKIPASWAGKRIWLKVGAVRAAAWIYVNAQQVAHLNNGFGSVKYDVTEFVKPGETARIVFDVSNLVPSRKGQTSGLHKWGGITRDVELEATPADCWIDDAWVRGDFDGKKAIVNVVVEQLKSCKVEQLRVTVEGGTGTTGVSPVGERKSASPSTGKKPVVPVRIDLDLSADFRPWSPEHPNLYTAKVELVSADGKVLQTRYERFGVRKLEVRGTDFYLNDKPLFLRGFGEDHVYPIEGVSPADRDVHRRHLAIARAAGYNFLRSHTHFEIPEYFDAADELGILIQGELPYYSDVPTEGFEFDPKRDVDEVYRTYRRHPSFAVYSMGNEGSFGKLLDAKLHRYVKALDPDRLKINQDCHNWDINPPEASDYLGGAISPSMWKDRPGYRCGKKEADRPVVCHEYLNLCVKSDYRDEAKYTGVWQPPATAKARAAWLGGFGLDMDWSERLQDAQHVLQKVWRKQGLEYARLQEECDGYLDWTIVDVVVWNDAVKWYSGQGVFNPFWETKRRGITPTELAKFNSASCVLCDLDVDKRVYAAGDTVKTVASFAHYGDEPLTNARLDWKLVAADGAVLAKGTQAIGDQALGKVRRIGDVAFTVPAVAKPTKANLLLSVTGEQSNNQTIEQSNNWTLWLFPKASLGDDTSGVVRAGSGPVRRPLPFTLGGVVVAAKDSTEAKAALAAGKNLITVDGADGKPNVSLGWWWMGAQVGTAIKNHPALGDFPHEGVLTPLLFRVVKDKGLELPTAEIPAKDMIVVGEGGQKCYLYLAERRIGSSRVLECHGLDLLSGLPEAEALLGSMAAWLR